MSSTHLESLSSSTNMTTMTNHSRKSQRVYRSPSNANEQLFYIKKEADNIPSAATTTTNTTANPSLMEIDAEDEEAGTILMSLAQHANRIRNHPSSSNTAAYDEKVSFVCVTYNVF